MLTFKNYIEGRSTRNQTVLVAAHLATKTRDPEAFVLDFAEAHYPHLYPRLVKAIYLENDALSPPGLSPEDESTPTQGGKNPAVSQAAGNFKNAIGGMKQAMDETGISGFFANLFGGGGARKNFDKAMKSLEKVNGVIATLKMPDEVKNSDNGLEGYDDFVEKLGGAIASMKDLSGKADMLKIADQVKKNPGIVDQMKIAQFAQDPELAPPQDDANGTPAAGGNAAQAPAAGTGTPTPDQMMQTKQAIFDRGDFSSFGSNAEAAKKAFLAIKPNLDAHGDNHDEIDKALTPILQKYGHPSTKGGKTESRRRRGRVMNESMREFLVLAGVPARRSR